VYGSHVSAIEADVVAEGTRLLARAAEAGIALRLLGGVAIRLRAPDNLPPPFARSYADLDFVTARGAAGPAAQLLRAEGYEPHVAFNALHGNERMLFFDERNGRQLDVFVGAFRMCHRVPLDERIEVDPVSIPLAELLLTKLQVIELNEKDVRDALALLHGHPVADEDGDAVNAARVARLCAEDWGLWRTIVQNLTVCRAYVETYELEPADRTEIEGRLDVLLERIEEEPKSRAWRLRNRIGDRKRWYELPEEVAGGP
jgi:Uncharacterised nucleotidyltransferase